jgi:hypothetical protein
LSKQSRSIFEAGVMKRNTREPHNSKKLLVLQ